MRTARLITWLSTMLILCTTASQVSAWGERGHRIVGHMARALLTPSAKTALQQLMGSDDLATFALYLDQHKDDLEQQIPGSRQWHYDDMPVCATSAPHDHCPQGQRCASVQVVRHYTLLSQRQTPKSRRQFAVRVLAHLVGDMHQPLHAADNHDRGGNEIQVLLPDGQSTNLHAAWDSAFVQHAFGQQSDRSIARRLVQRYAPRATAWQAGTIGLPQMQTWLRETNQAAQTVAYGQLTGFACGAARTSTPVTLSAAYLGAASQLIEEQLAKAGYRLAAVFNSVFRR